MRELLVTWGNDDILICSILVIWQLKQGGGGKNVELTLSVRFVIHSYVTGKIMCIKNYVHVTPSHPSVCQNDESGWTQGEKWSYFILPYFASLNPKANAH